MHPEIENFLDEAFGSIQPTSPEIGRVVIEPDYDMSPAMAEASDLRDELIRCLKEQRIDTAALASQEGIEAKIPRSYGLLARYLRRVTLHQDKLDGSWVEIAPPGNWI